MDVMKLSQNYAATAQIRPEDVQAIADAGFVTIICNRPDNEEPGQPDAESIRAACGAAGIAFHHVPVTGMYIAPEATLLHRSIIEESDGPVLAYCRSGHRSMVIYESGAA